MKQGFRMELLSIIIFFLSQEMILEPTEIIKWRFWISLVPRWRNRSWILRVKHRGRSSIRGWVAQMRGMEGSNWRHVEEDRVQQVFQRFAEGIGAEVHGGLSDDSQVPCFCSYLSSSRSWPVPQIQSCFPKLHLPVFPVLLPFFHITLLQPQNC